VGYAIYYVVRYMLYSLWVVLYLKMKHGKDIVTFWGPVSGMLLQMRKSLEKHGNWL